MYLINKWYQFIISFKIYYIEAWFTLYKNSNKKKFFCQAKIFKIQFLFHFTSYTKKKFDFLIIRYSPYKVRKTTKYSLSIFSKQEFRVITYTQTHMKMKIHIFIYFRRVFSFYIVFEYPIFSINFSLCSKIYGKSVLSIK